MRYLIGFIAVLALAMMSCSETSGTGGSGGDGGACVDNVCACTEAGIRAAIAEGGGPFTFDCDGPMTVVTEATIEIDNDVILDGEGNLTVDGDLAHRVFQVAEGVTTALTGITVTEGAPIDRGGGGIRNYGTLTLTNTTVSGNTVSAFGSGITNEGTLTLTNTTVSGNTSERDCGRDICGGAIANLGTLTMTNSTVSDNANGGVWNIVDGIATIVSSTVTDDGDNIVQVGLNPALTVINSLVTGCLHTSGTVSSGGHNIDLESSGNTCGFDQPTDQVNVSADDLKLGPLQDNGGPTMTHALGEGSVAIDQIPAVDCVDADGVPLTTDQRGEPRPGGTMCDVGAFEVQP